MARKRRRSQRAGGAAVVIELMEQREQSQTCLNSAESRQKKTKGQHGGSIISRDVISDLHSTEFRMMLMLMVKVMYELPDDSDLLFLTNAAYIQNFDYTTHNGTIRSWDEYEQRLTFDDGIQIKANEIIDIHSAHLYVQNARTHI